MQCQPIGLSHVSVEGAVGLPLSVLVKEHQPTFAFREEGVVVVHSIDITDGSKAVFQSNDVLNGVASTVVVGLTPQR